MFVHDYTNPQGQNYPEAVFYIKAATLNETSRENFSSAEFNDIPANNSVDSSKHIDYVAVYFTSLTAKNDGYLPYQVLNEYNHTSFSTSLDSSYDNLSAEEAAEKHLKEYLGVV